MRPPDPTPSLHRHYSGFNSTMGRSAPVSCIGTLASRFGPLELLPLHQETGSCSSTQTPVSNSRPLPAQHRSHRPTCDGARRPACARVPPRALHPAPPRHFQPRSFEAREARRPRQHDMCRLEQGGPYHGIPNFRDTAVPVGFPGLTFLRRQTEVCADGAGFPEACRVVHRRTVCPRNQRTDISRWQIGSAREIRSISR